MPLAGKVGAVFLQTEAEPVAFIKESAAGNPERTVYAIENEALRYRQQYAHCGVRQRYVGQRRI
ncbi:MAG: hypothetical protein DDT21_02067 [Syntrophomonadaceae bacterium]|nr:hypothetical protein [Bacillota bacterium]